MFLKAVSGNTESIRLVAHGSKDYCLACACSKYANNKQTGTTNNQSLIQSKPTWAVKL